MNKVLFCEEPIYDSSVPGWEVSTRHSGVTVAVPHLPVAMQSTAAMVVRGMFNELLERCGFDRYVCWLYTPIAVSLIADLEPDAVIFDCMDELSAFRGAPEGLKEAEAELFKRSDLIFTGGRSLFEAKRHKHRSVHCFPSSIDLDFFSSARDVEEDPHDQQHIPRPRLGYCGVIDERMDTDLLASIADTRPDWNIVLLGPVVKISPSELPRRPNIHYLGGKQYRDLPSYLGNWDVALLPFAQNESTKFISPTKTPEYLAAGLPVVSTPIADVVKPYGELGFVHIAANASAFVDAIDNTLKLPWSPEHSDKLNRFLAGNSWDLTWERMESMVRAVVLSKDKAHDERVAVSETLHRNGLRVNSIV
jgi:glycosyltransferase involved in cell wall biosynthesis